MVIFNQISNLWARVRAPRVYVTYNYGHWLMFAKLEYVCVFSKNIGRKYWAKILGEKYWAKNIGRKILGEKNWAKNIGRKILGEFICQNFDFWNKMSIFDQNFNLFGQIFDFLTINFDFSTKFLFSTNSLKFK